MKLPNPNDGKPFDRVLKDENGKEVYGIRKEHTPEEEIVHIPTNRSTQQYWKPEMVMNPEGCNHEFIITSVGKREIECPKCHFATTFIVGVNFFEKNKKLSVKIRNRFYSVSKP